MIPKLPPRAGYVEVEIDGIRQYQKIRTQEDELIEVLQAENAALKDENIAIMEALAEVYETIIGGGV